MLKSLELSSKTTVIVVVIIALSIMNSDFYFTDTKLCFKSDSNNDYCIAVT